MTLNYYYGTEQNIQDISVVRLPRPLPVTPATGLVLSHIMTS